jgi:Ca2+-binding EF-hand superfamily protein
LNLSSTTPLFRPFEGILLGIFFLTAGASLDPYVVANNLPTLVIGISVFIVTKALVLFVAGPSYGKTGAGAARVAITLSGGGEFSLVLFALAQDLGVLDDKLANLLTASVIISMSLTPLLGEVADAAGKYLEVRDGRRILAEVDEVLTTEGALALFEGIDTDNSGTIEFDELRTALVERGLSYVSIAEIFAKFDENGDGFISQDEWTLGMEAGYLASALTVNAAAVNAGGGQKTEAGMNIASDAIVICGFTEGAKDLYAVLEVAGITQNGSVVAFELSPKRVSAGIASGANIIYGDGASVSLMRAAGVTKPRAVIIMYRSEARRLEATERLKGSLPDGTPIYTRVISGQSLSKKELLDAGATEVVNERTEAALRFGALLGAFRTSAEVAEMRTELTALAKGAPPSPMEDIPGLPEDRLNDLADEFECTRRDLVRLFKIFASLPEVGDDKFVDISDLRDVLLRTAGDGPIDDTALSRWVERADSEGGGTLSFVDFARVYFGSPGQTARE